MATKKNTKKGRTTRRPTKAELERQKAIKRMIATFVLALILLFAAIKLGAFGVTIYNMIRLLVGSLAYLAILASFGYLFFFKWLHKHEGTVSGFISLFLGLELIFQAYFVSVLKLEGAAVLSTTLGRVLTDLTAFKVSSFAGGGLLLALNPPRPPAEQQSSQGSQNASPSPTAADSPGSSNAGIKVGDVLRGEDNCPTTAKDAQGVVGADGRVTSAGGLSYPVIPDFVASPIDYGFIHQSNSTTKAYQGQEGQAAVTVGTLKSEDGFKDPLPSAVRVVQCVIANPRFYNSKPTAEVTQVAVNENDGTVVLQVHVPAEGRPGGQGDRLAVAVYSGGSRSKQVVVSLAPQNDSATLDAVNTALAGLRLNT